MQVALICPPALLKKYGSQTRYHMALPHLYQQKRYRDFFKERSQAGDFIILDNGAAEKYEFGHKHLFHIAENIGAHEIVVPDTLGDYNDTIAKGMAFARYAKPGYRYMMVAQGSNVHEAMRTVDAMATSPTFTYVTTIGIPRLLNIKDRHARFKVTKYIIQEGYHKALDIHYLGANKPLDEVGYLEEAGVGRGIDTSAPIYMGMKRKLIISDDWVRRPNDFFVMSKDESEIQMNIDTYLRWANYDRDAELPERI